MKNVSLQFVSFVIFTLMLAGCGTQVSRVDVKESHDLSGAWTIPIRV